MAARSKFCDKITRREALTLGVTGLFGLSLPDLLRLEAQARQAPGADATNKRQANAVILVNLGGGPADDRHVGR